MNSTNYLYGAAVQGIQGFIFQTNRLKEILGASELVAQICTDLFAKTLSKIKKQPVTLGADGDGAIVNAAGNIKYIFKSKEECEEMVRIFPKTVMEFAPGITISQSVVKYEADSDFAEAVKQLEKNLRTQRNKPMHDLSIGLTGMLRSRETGLPVSHVRGKEYMDSGTFHKLYEGPAKERKDTTQELCVKAFGDKYEYENLPFEISKITGNNNWIAIIHADGNGLGQVMQKIGADPKVLHEFSENLDIATTRAAQRAFAETIKDVSDQIIPLRPIVLSGDDHTVICRADLAIPYTEKFLEFFEEETKSLLGETLTAKGVFKNKKDYLTACAGIAFIKSSFPFHFGYQLAEALCDRAKKDSKALFNAAAGNLPASCLMFHKVQDSFVTDYNDIVERELTPQKNISFEFGPYYLNDTPNKNRWTIKMLNDNVAEFEGKDGNAAKSGLRKWMSILHEDANKAKQHSDRMKDTLPGKKDFIDTAIKLTARANDGKDKEKGRCVAYDLITLHTINTQTTK